MNFFRKTPWGKPKWDPLGEKTTFEVTKIEHLIEEDIKTGATRLSDIDKELSPHVTDVFRALGNYDVRFDFDPFSVDDCRCNILSCHEMSVLCSLKHIPLHALVIEEGDLPGGLMLKLKDDFFQRFDEVSWEDFFDTKSNDRYLDPTKVYDYLSKAICHAVNDVRSEMVNAYVEVLHSPTMISLWFQFPKDSFYKVNFFPSIRVNNLCENFQNLVNQFSNLRQPLLHECHFEMGIHVVARPNKPSEDGNKLWSITFNDIEKRVVLSESFECAKDCLIYIDEKLKLLYEEKRLSSYQIRAVILREIFENSKPKSWKRNCLNKRLHEVQESLNADLQMGRCENVFTGVNLFSGTSQDTLDQIAKYVYDNLHCR